MERNGKMPKELLLEFLATQDVVAVAHGDFDPVVHEVRRIPEAKEANAGFQITLTEVKVSFCFDAAGRFQGIANYKE